METRIKIFYLVSLSFLLFNLIGCDTKSKAMSANSMVESQTGDLSLSVGTTEFAITSETEKQELAEAAGGVIAPTSNIFSLVDGVLYCGEVPVDTSISSLDLRSAIFDDWSFIANFDKLERLSIADSNICSNDLTYLSCLSSLSALYLIHCEQIRSIENLEKLSDLEELYITFSSINDFSTISKITSLKTIHFYNCFAISDITFLDEMANLDSIVFSSCMQIQDFSPLQDLTNLVSLDLSYTQFSDNDLLYLINMKKLKNLSLYCENIKDYSVLCEMDFPDLQFLSCNATLDELVALKVAYPNCKITIPIID